MINYIINGKEYTSEKPIKIIGDAQGYENGTIIYRNEELSYTRPIGLFYYIDKTNKDYIQTLDYLTEDEKKTIEQYKDNKFYIRFFFKSRKILFESAKFIDNITNIITKTIFGRCYVGGIICFDRKVYKCNEFLKQGIYVLNFTNDNDFTVKKVGYFNIYNYLSSCPNEKIQNFVKNEKDSWVRGEYYKNKTIYIYFKKGKKVDYEILDN